jgi:hypothetical protein
MRQPIGSSFLESEKGSGLGTWAKEGRGTMKKEKNTSLIPVFSLRVQKAELLQRTQGCPGHSAFWQSLLQKAGPGNKDFQ